MHRLRIATAAAMVCLSLSGMPVLAQEAPEDVSDAMVFVTGTEKCGQRAPWIPSRASSGVIGIRDAATSCVTTMSDPRVSGSWRNTMSVDCYGDGFCLVWGTNVLDGPDGGWDCSWTASDFPIANADTSGDPPYLVIAICSGTGDYEGLSYVLQHTDAMFPGDTSFQGVIYEGPPPPLGVALAGVPD